MDIKKGKQSLDEHESEKEENAGVDIDLDSKPVTCNFLWYQGKRGFKHKTPLN